MTSSYSWPPQYPHYLCATRLTVRILEYYPEVITSLAGILNPLWQYTYPSWRCSVKWVHRQSTDSILLVIGSYINLQYGLALMYPFGFLLPFHYELDKVVNCLPHVRALKHLGHQVTISNFSNWYTTTPSHTVQLNTMWSAASSCLLQCEQLEWGTFPIL